MNNNSKDTSLRLVLFEPRIPQNTGNIARTCAAFNLSLELIEPLGFSLDDKYLKRAGLDYWPYVNISCHKSFEDFLNTTTEYNRLIGCSKTYGTNISNLCFKHGDILLFGREDNGLTSDVRNRCHEIATIPMVGSANNFGEHGVRSLNLSVSVGIICFKAGNDICLW